MAETFTWPIKNSVQIRFKPKVRKISFGDGYEQRNQKGMNQNLPSFNVEIMPKQADIEAVIQFLDEHGGVTAFNWTRARQASPGLYVCDTWSVTDETHEATIRATFREVVA